MRINNAPRTDPRTTSATPTPVPDRPAKTTKFAGERVIETISPNRKKPWIRAAADRPISMGQRPYGAIRNPATETTTAQPAASTRVFPRSARAGDCESIRVT